MGGPSPSPPRCRRPPTGGLSETAKEPAFPLISNRRAMAMSLPPWFMSITVIRRLQTMDKRLGTRSRAKIVIARYGEGWRGLKVKRRRIMRARRSDYSDPAMTATRRPCPIRKALPGPPQGISSAVPPDMMIYPGDPLTPGVAPPDD